MRPVWAMLFAAASVLAAAEVEIPENPAKAQAGFETGAWTIEGWGNNGSAEPVQLGERKLLRLTYEGGDKEKAAYRQALSYSAAAEGKVRLHVYAPQENPPKLAIVLWTGASQVYYEAKPLALKQGWNALEAPLGERTWKTEATEWKYQASVAEPQKVQAIGLIVLNDKSSGWLAVEGLEADPDEATRKVLALVEKLQDKDGELRAQAETELVAAGEAAVPYLKQLRAHGRPEVALRAGWALDKIEARLEEQRQKEEAQRREAAAFIEARQRLENLAREMLEGRDKLQTLVQQAREELIRARAALKDLKAPSEDERRAYEEAVEKLDKASKELLKQVGAPPEQKTE